MEKLLEKLARQLDSIDEASLMALWSKYATITSRFEPTRRWEEACLIFSLIQAKHFKNQLFNYCWQQARQINQSEEMPKGAVPEFDLQRPPKTASPPCRVLSFRADKNGEKPWEQENPGDTDGND